MKRKLALFALVFTALALLAAGCSSQTAPEEVYWQYWEACSEGKFRVAEEFLSENARATARTLGSCAFTHDAINTIEAADGNPPRTFSTDPEVNIIEDRSTISWIDDEGNIAFVILLKIDDSWKIIEATWSR